MRSRLRLFALVGVLATAIDLGLFVVLGDAVRDGRSVSTPRFQLSVV